MAIDLKAIRELMRPGCEAKAKRYWDEVSKHVDIEKLTYDELVALFFGGVNYIAAPFVKLGPKGEVLEVNNGNSRVILSE